jgi:predicted DNA-binding transcriptional regulator AlpA
MRKLMGTRGPEDQPRFYSVADTARIFGVSEMTVYRAIRDAQFPAVRIMGRLIVPAKAIESMADAAVVSGALVDAADWVVSNSSPEQGTPVHSSGGVR